MSTFFYVNLMRLHTYTEEKLCFEKINYSRIRKVKVFQRFENQKKIGSSWTNTTQKADFLFLFLFTYIILVIVDNTAAPALYIVGQLYSCSLCSSLKYTDS